MSASTSRGTKSRRGCYICRMKLTARQTERIRVTMLSGSFEYDSEDSLTVLIGYLHENAPIIESQLIVYQSEDDSPSLELLDRDTDVLLVFARRLTVAGSELERLKQYCAAGKPIVGIRTASHAFQQWLAFDPEVLGGNYNGHFSAGPRCKVEKMAPEDAILDGVLPFESHGSLYRTGPLAADARLLLNGSTDDHSEAAAWSRVRDNGGRVFYTSLGQQKDFWELDFLRLIENALLWAADQAPVPT